MMLIHTHKFVLVLFFVVTNAIYAFGQSNEKLLQTLPTFDQIIEKIEVSYKYRADLLRKSTGNARLQVTRVISQEMGRKLSLQMEAQNIEFRSFAPKCGNIMNVKWYSQGDYYRYDEEIQKNGDLQVCKPLLDTNIASNNNYSIYYNTIERKGYINNAFDSYPTLTGYIHLFDIQRCYGGSDTPLYIALKTYNQDDVLIQRENLNGLPHIHIIYKIRTNDNDEGDFRIFQIDVWLSELQNYAESRIATHTEFYSNGSIFDVIDSDYRAEYEQSNEYPNVFILKKLYQYKTQQFVEELWIEFSDVRLGIDLPVETFNFDGLGVPVGMPIFDKRNPGPSTLYYYLPGVYVGLDRLDLAAGAVEMPPDVQLPDQAPSEPLPEPAPEPAVTQDAPPPQVETGSSSAPSSFQSVYFAVAVIILLGCVALITFKRRRKQGTRNK